LIAVSIALISVGGLLSVWIYNAVSDTAAVVAARSTIERGSTIDRDDLVTVQVSTDPALAPISASDADSLIGKRAATDIPGGSLLSQESVADSVTPEQGASVVGLSLSPAKMPASALRNGDAVRIVATPGEGGDVVTQDPITFNATVLTVGSDGVDGQKVVDVVVADRDAAVIATHASTGRVAIVLDSRER
jgi:hypothetical protein